MTALAGPQRTSRTRERGVLPFDAADGVVIYPGALVGVDTAGKARPWRNDAADRFVGVCREPTNHLGVVMVDTSGGPIIRDVLVLNATAASVGVEFRCSTDNYLQDLDVDDPSVDSRAIGVTQRFVRFVDRSGEPGPPPDEYYFDIALYSMHEFAARYEQSTT